MKYIIFTCIFILILSGLQAQNYVLDFDGTDDFIQTTYGEEIQTIEFWFKTDGFNTDQGLFGQRDDALEEAGNWQMHWDETSPYNKLRIYAYSANSSTGWNNSTNGDDGTGNSVTVFGGEFVTNTTFSTGTWYHVAVVSTGTELRYYVNGALDNTKTNDFVLGGVNNADDLTIGGSFDNATLEPFNGMIDEVRVWSDVRTVTEIQDNMYAQLDGTEAGLVAYYPISSGSGTTLTDNSYSYNGTINGGAAWVIPSVNFSVNANWSAVTNWNGGVPPPHGFNIIIDPNSSITFDQDYTCNNLTFGASTSSFTCSPPNTLTIIGNVIDGNGKVAIEVNSALEVSSSIEIAQPPQLQ